MKIQRLKTLLEKKVEGLALLDFETNYRATVIRLCVEDIGQTHIQMEQNEECSRRARHMCSVDVEEQWLSQAVEKHGLLQ